MLITCIGVGEAFDFPLGNASFLLQEKKTSLLIDCGFGVPGSLIERYPDPNAIDAIYITHFHADHCFGIPILIHRWFEDGRDKPLTLIGQPGTKEGMEAIGELAYPGMQKRIPYPIHTLETAETLPFHHLKLTVAPSQHGQQNYAIRIDSGKTQVAFSGDGALTDETKALFKPCQLLVHEAYRLSQKEWGHTSATSVVEFAKTLPHLKHLWLVHIFRHDRRAHLEAIQALGENAPFQLTIPNNKSEIQV